MSSMLLSVRPVCSTPGFRSGAPFDILLAADQRRPRLLEEEGRIVSGSRFTYAAGRLALWSPDPDRVSATGTLTLETGHFRKLAIANPELAPYGLAAKQTLESLGMYKDIARKLVMGANIGQTHVMVSTRNAELGFVALSYLESPRNRQAGSRWVVPADLHDPIHQDAVLLERAANNEAASAFLEYLQSQRASKIIERFGYTALPSR
ncbi:MAG: molybdate ABC transporter substrate-binding protein [Gammaproteobacteria bacterium]|nr:molybdate ABC transporter substrate-binding protein [Gammaproteobacteria bacterium]